MKENFSIKKKAFYKGMAISTFNVERVFESN